jgi:hypothetical protein
VARRLLSVYHDVVVVVILAILTGIGFLSSQITLRLINVGVALIYIRHLLDNNARSCRLLDLLVGQKLLPL